MFRMNYSISNQNPAIPRSIQMQNIPIKTPNIRFQYNMLNMFKTEGCTACGK